MFKVAVINLKRDCANHNSIFSFKMHGWIPYLWDGIFVADHGDDIVEGEEAVALDLRVHVLPHGTAR